jgi:hypothetical protein
MQPGQLVFRLSEFVVIQTGLDEPQAHVQLRGYGVRAKADERTRAAVWIDRDEVA